MAGYVLYIEVYLTLLQGSCQIKKISDCNSDSIWDFYGFRPGFPGWGGLKGHISAQNSGGD